MLGCVDFVDLQQVEFKIVRILTEYMILIVRRTDFNEETNLEIIRIDKSDGPMLYWSFLFFWGAIRIIKTIGARSYYYIIQMV